MAVVPGYWMENPGKLAIYNPKKTKRRKKALAKTKRRRKRAKGRKRTYRRKRHYGRKNPRTVYRANRKRRHHKRRRKSYAKRNSPRRRRYSRRRYRRNASGAGKLLSRSTGIGKRLLSGSMVSNVIAGFVGYAGVNILESFVPYLPTTGIGYIGKKVVAGVGTYLLATMFFTKPSSKKYVLYGAAFNIGLEIIQSQFSGVAKAAKLSGYGMEFSEIPPPARMLPHLGSPTLVG